MISIASAQVTGLDIDFVNPPAVVNKDLNFQATWAGGDANVAYWQFDVDGNVLQFGPTGDILKDDFEDQDISDWNVISGSWSAAGGNLVSSGGGEISFDTGVVNSFAADQLIVEFDVNATNVAVSISDENRLGVGNGYRLTTAGGEYKLKTIVAGVETDRLTISNAVGGGTNIKWVFDTNGLISGFRNDVLEGSIVDTNFNSFQYVIVDATANGGLQDINVLGGQSVIQSGISQTHSFSTTGQKTIQLTIQNVDGNASTSLDINVGGALNLTIFDENKGTPISGATIDFNSGTYVTDALGQINIPLTGLTSGEKTITVDVNSDYPTRQFIFDLNEFSAEDLNLLMLENKDGSSREYQIYQPNQTTLITNSLVEWRRTSLIPNGIAQRTRTDASAKLTFFGQQDADYVMRITDSVASVIRDYNGTVVTVNRPVNIEDFSQVLTPYSVTVGGLAVHNFTGLTANQSFQIFSDTTGFYNIGVDFNTDFFGTNILTRTLGGQATLTIQPFLVPQTGNLETTVFTINDALGRITQGGIRIESRTDLNGSSTLVESLISDATGQALMHFESGRDYELKFFNTDGTLLFTANITATDTQLFTFLNPPQDDGLPTPQQSVRVQWFPSRNAIPIDGNITLSQILTPSNVTIGDVIVTASHIADSNIVFTRTFSVNSASDFNLSYDINVTGFNDDFPLKVNLVIENSGGSRILDANRLYSFKSTDSIATATERARNAIGQFGLTFLALLLTVIVVGRITSNRVGEDNNFVVIPAMFITGIFVFLGWIEFLTWTASVLFAIGFSLWGLNK